MSVSFSAYAFLGCEIDPARLYRKVRGRGCGHREPPAGAKFCPECGKPAFVEGEEPVEGYDPEDGDHGTLEGLPLVTVGEGEYGRAFVCVEAVEADDYHDRMAGMLAPPDVAAAREELRAALEPLGLWDGQKFGLWAVLVCC